jgi:hypothetical protein
MGVDKQRLLLFGLNIYLGKVYGRIVGEDSLHRNIRGLLLRFRFCSSSLPSLYGDKSGLFLRTGLASRVNKDVVWNV